MKTETPRTDAAWDESSPLQKLSEKERREFAGQLERELRDARQQMIGLRREIEHQKARAAAMPNVES